MNILVSACLLGCACRYDGESKENKEIQKLVSCGTAGGSYETICLIPVCPEIYGGLKTPRLPSERIDGKVINSACEDMTAAFEKGAKEALHLARLYNCKYAILKERSPSCGHGTIYDGTFSGSLTDGNGLTAELLTSEGIAIFGESDVKELIRLLSPEP